MFTSGPGYHGNSEFRPTYELAKRRQTSPLGHLFPQSNSQPSKAPPAPPPPLRKYSHRSAAARSAGVWRSSEDVVPVVQGRVRRGGRRDLQGVLRGGQRDGGGAQAGDRRPPLPPPLPPPPLPYPRRRISPQLRPPPPRHPLDRRGRRTRCWAHPRHTRRARPSRHPCGSPFFHNFELPLCDSGLIT
jgi:hypothetical protein